MTNNNSTGERKEHTQIHNRSCLFVKEAFN